MTAADHEGRQSPSDAARIDGLVGVGAAVRRVVDALVSTEIGAADLDELTAVLAGVEERLRTRLRAFGEPSPLDALIHGRLFGPVVGPASPLAPPLTVSFDEGGGVVARCVLGMAYEGPRGFCHGGVSALILDEVTAKVPELRSQPRVTKSLDVGYRRPVPLGRPLVITAGVVEERGRETLVDGAIAVADAPSEVLVSARVRFVRMSEEQQERFRRSAGHVAAQHEGPGLSNVR